MDITFTDNDHTLLHGPPGTARWHVEEGHLSFICPCGCGCLAGVNFKPKHAHGWHWDGNLERPTVTPSILIQPCGWHGYLTNGDFVKC